ncbi:MAG: hypothetical protein NUV51_11100 [Sulfuricaulis sp.]|nr:hypothetical protein [Sulfuricaulis sp.]
MTFATDRAALQTATDAALASAESFLSTLVSASAVSMGAIPFNVTRFLPDYRPAYSPPAVPTVDDVPINDSARPDIPSLVMPLPPDSPGLDIFNFASLPEIVIPPDDIPLLTASDFSFDETAYQSILLDPLKAKLLADLTDGGYGIDTTDEVALFNRARDREVEIALTRIEDAGRVMASRGFPLPPGELSIHVDRAWQDMQNKVSGASRDITLERSKLFVENRQFTLREIRELEQITMGFWNSVQERAFNVARAAAEFGVSFYNARLGYYKLRFDLTKLASDVRLDTIRGQAEQARVRLELYRGEIAKFDASLRALIDPNRLAIDVYRADLDAARLDIDRGLGAAGVAAKIFDSSVQYNINQDKVITEGVRIKLEAAMAELKFRLDGAGFAADKYFAVLTALSSSANTLAVQSEAL